MKEKPNSLYTEFWGKFILIITETCHPSHLSFNISKNKIKDKTCYKISLREPICLIAWPSRRSKAGSVNIIVDFNESYEETNAAVKIVESHAFIHYCKNIRAKDNSIAIESIRFDFHPDIGAADGDPLVHLHIGIGKKSKSLTDSVLSEHLRKKLVKAPEQPIAFNPLELECLNDIHIPTIQISLPGVLCSLVADHIRGTGMVRDIIDKTEDIFDKLSKHYQVIPKKGSIDLWKHASARYWYNYEGAQNQPPTKKRRA